MIGVPLSPLPLVRSQREPIRSVSRRGVVPWEAIWPFRSLSFSRIELSLDMSDKSKATRMMLVRKPLTLRFTPRDVSLVVTYRKGEDGKFRLGYFRSTMRFGCSWRRRLFQTSYTAVNELVVTDLREPATPIERKDIFRVSDIMNDKAAEFLDPDFWEDYNIIEPSESLEHAIGRLKKQIK